MPPVPLLNRPAPAVLCGLKQSWNGNRDDPKSLNKTFNFPIHMHLGLIHLRCFQLGIHLFIYLFYVNNKWIHHVASVSEWVFYTFFPTNAFGLIDLCSSNTLSIGLFYVGIVARGPSRRYVLRRTTLTCWCTTGRALVLRVHVSCCKYCDSKFRPMNWCPCSSNLCRAVSRRIGETRQKTATTTENGIR